MRRVALVVLAVATIAGCGSTVLLGTVSLDGGPGVDFARPRDGGGGAGADIIDFGPFDGFDGGLLDLGFDGGLVVDLAQ